MNFDSYKFRCSSLGDIMTNSRTKSDPISQTAKSMLKKIFTLEVLGKHSDVESKYLEKGLVMEPESIQLYSDNIGKSLTKNDTRYTNKYLSGEPDIVSGDLLVDIKTSWNASTFPLCETVAPKNYYWQLQGYMELTGISKSKLVYCLVNTPYNLIERELWDIRNEIGIIDLSEDIIDSVTKKHTFDDIDVSLRIKEIEVLKDEESIEILYERIGHCRNYLNELYETFINL